MAVNVDREPVVYAIQDDPMAMRRLLGIGDAGAHTTLVKIAATYERTLLSLRAVRHAH